jgi:hypothetical protein
VHPLARFTVELASPEGGWAAIEVATARARHAAEEMRAEGTPVRFLRSIFVPEDETCFFLYEGPSADAIRAAASRAELGERQVQETITDARRVGQLRSADDSFVKEEP